MSLPRSGAGVCLACGLLVAGVAGAAPSRETRGRIALSAGWRLTPNDHFLRAARAQGWVPQAARPPGGPVGLASFSYGATEILEVSVDLFAGSERLSFANRPALSTISYGAVLGGRLVWTQFSEALTPYLALGAGPTLVVASDSAGASEVLATAYAGGLGCFWHLSDAVGLVAEYRHFLVRGAVPSAGGINAGGHWLSLGVFFDFPPADPKAPLWR